jgi:malonate transporter and related proteins
VNLGIPVAVYVLGDASYVVPVLLLQLAVLTPAALAVLDTASRGARPVRQRVLAPVSNPITIACLVGLAVGLADVPVPETVLRPVQLVGGAAVPVALVTFGLSLHRAPVPGGGDTFRAVWLAVALKTVVQPAVAFAFASFALGMRGAPLLGATVTAALPTAQNVFVYATRYGRGVALARDAVLLTTFLSLPVLLGIAAVMG